MSESKSLVKRVGESVLTLFLLAIVLQITADILWSVMPLLIVLVQLVIVILLAAGGRWRRW